MILIFSSTGILSLSERWGVKHESNGTEWTRDSDTSVSFLLLQAIYFGHFCAYLGEFLRCLSQPPSSAYFEVATVRRCMCWIKGMDESRRQKLRNVERGDKVAPWGRCSLSVSEHAPACVCAYLWVCVCLTICCAVTKKRKKKKKTKKSGRMKAGQNSFCMPGPFLIRTQRPTGIDPKVNFSTNLWTWIIIQTHMCSHVICIPSKPFRMTLNIFQSNHVKMHCEFNKPFILTGNTVN